MSNTIDSASSMMSGPSHFPYPGGVGKLGQQFPKIGEGGPIGQIDAIIKDTVEISDAGRALAGLAAGDGGQASDAGAQSGGEAEALNAAIALSLVA